MRPDIALQRLLDALEREVLDATEEELRSAASGRSLGSTLHRIRSVVHAATADDDVHAPTGVSTQTRIWKPLAGSSVDD